MKPGLTLFQLILLIHAVLSSASVFAQERSARIIFEDGSDTVARITGIDEKSVFVKNKEKAYSLDQIARIEFAGPPGSLTGSLVSMDKPGRISVKGNRIRFQENLAIIVDSAEKPIASIRRGTLGSVRFPGTEDSEAWKTAVLRASKSDGLLVERGDRIDFLDGVIKSIDADKVVFETRGRTVNVTLEKLVGVAFFQPPLTAASRLIAVRDRYDNQYRGDRAIRQQDKLLIGSGDQLIEVPWENVRSIDAGSARWVPLETMKPLTVAWTPMIRAKTSDAELETFIEKIEQLRKTWTAGNSFGKPISMDFPSQSSETKPTGRVVFPGGVSIRGGTSLVFQVPSQAERFRARAGIQTGCPKGTSVRLVVQQRGTTLYDKFVSNGLDGPLEIDVPVTGDRITIRVEYGDDGDTNDVLSLGGAGFRLK